MIQKHSDFKNRGIYEFETYQDAIDYQRNKHIEYNNQRNVINEEILNCLHIYEYTNPIYGCTMKEFISNILENGKEVGNNMGRMVDL